MEPIRRRRISAAPRFCEQVQCTIQAMRKRDLLEDTLHTFWLQFNLFVHKVEICPLLLRTKFNLVEINSRMRSESFSLWEEAVQQWDSNVNLIILSRTWESKSTNEVKITIFYSFFQTPFNTSEEAKHAVATGKLYGALHFSRNFSTALGKRVTDGDVEDDVVDDSSVSVWLDMTSESISSLCIICLVYHQHIHDTIDAVLVSLLH